MPVISVKMDKILRSNIELLSSFGQSGGIKLSSGQYIRRDSGVRNILNAPFTMSENKQKKHLYIG